MYRTSGDVTSRVEIDVTRPLCVLLQLLVYWPGYLRNQRPALARHIVSVKKQSGVRMTLDANDNMAC